MQSYLGIISDNCTELNKKWFKMKKNEKVKRNLKKGLERKNVKWEEENAKGWKMKETWKK